MYCWTVYIMGEKYIFTWSWFVRYIIWVMTYIAFYVRRNNLVRQCPTRNSVIVIIRNGLAQNYILQALYKISDTLIRPETIPAGFHHFCSIQLSICKVLYTISEHENLGFHWTRNMGWCSHPKICERFVHIMMIRNESHWDSGPGTS